MKTHLLIDGDVIAFSSAAAVQQVLIGDHGWAQPFANTKMGEAVVENSIFALMKGLGADTYEVILTDPQDNWRKAVDPSYKETRHDDWASKLARPLLLSYLKDYLREKHKAFHWAGLEADDVLSWKMTDPRFGVHGPELAQRLVCVGRDKDFNTIPGLHHTWKKDLDAKGNMLVREVTEWEADRFHLMQTLAGDIVDGFRGCPGIGMKRAADIIDNPVLLVPKEGVKTRGVNKGEGTVKWMSEPTRDLWACIVSHYRKAGQGEAEALVSARLARLLRYDEYDPETEALTLWTPDKLRIRG